MGCGKTIAVGVLITLSSLLQISCQPDELGAGDSALESDVAVESDVQHGFESDTPELPPELHQRLSLAKLLSALKGDPTDDAAVPEDQDAGIDPWSPPLQSSDDTSPSAAEINMPLNAASAFADQSDDESLRMHLDSDRSGDVSRRGDLAAHSMGESDENINIMEDKATQEEEEEEDRTAHALHAKGSGAYFEQSDKPIMTELSDVRLPSDPMSVIDESDHSFKQSKEEEVTTAQDLSPPRRPRKAHKLNFHSHARPKSFHDIHMHVNATSSLAQTRDEDIDGSSGSSRAKANISPPLDSLTSLVKALYYDGVLALSVPMRHIAIVLLVFCVACPCFCMYWMTLEDKSAKGRNRYTHKGRAVYEWKDTAEVATLYTKLPKGLTSKSLEIKFWPRHLKMGRSGKMPFIREELFSSVNVEECTWNVVGDELVVTLCKDEKVTWPCVFRAHNPKDRAQTSSLL